MSCTLQLNNLATLDPQGKINRDIKLANTLLLLAPGQLPLVKLCDFGFSKDRYHHSDAQSQVRRVKGQLRAVTGP